MSEYDAFVKELASVGNKPQLEALKATFSSFGIIPRQYSLLADRDESVCLIFRNGKWVVYTSERGQESWPKTFSELDMACLEMINALSNNAAKREQMTDFFLESLEC